MTHYAEYFNAKMETLPSDESEAVQQEALALFQAGKLVPSPWPDGGVTRAEY